MGTGRMLTFGYGRCARTLALVLQEQGWSVAATLRDEAQAPALRAQGIAPVPLAQPGRLAQALEEATHLLVSAPPDAASGDPLLATRLPLRHLHWVGYLSTTGVYGDRRGGWVDEETPPAPLQPRSLARLAAERAWTASGAALQIFRLAGIYGPGRNAVEDLLAGRARRIHAPGHVFSRIHQDDIVAALQAAIAAPQPGSVLNLADDRPASSADIVEHAAALLGMAPPAWQALDDPQTGALLHGFYAESRRVGNARLKALLGGPLLYPSYVEGLSAAISLRQSHVARQEN